MAQLEEQVRIASHRVVVCHAHSVVKCNWADLSARSPRRNGKRTKARNARKILNQFDRPFIGVATLRHLSLKLRCCILTTGSNTPLQFLRSFPNNQYPVQSASCGGRIKTCSTTLLLSCYGTARLLVGKSTRKDLLRLKNAITNTLVIQKIL